MRARKRNLLASSIGPKNRDINREVSPADNVCELKLLPDHRLDPPCWLSEGWMQIKLDILNDHMLINSNIVVYWFDV